MSIAAGVLAFMGQAPARAQEEFTITGEVGGLYPGRETTIDAQVANRQPFPIRVRSLAVTASDASTDCSAVMLELGSARTPVDIAPGATGTVLVDVRMDPEAPDECQGATWPLAFTGTATEVQATTAPHADGETGSGTAESGTSAGEAERGTGRGRAAPGKTIPTAHGETSAGDATGPPTSSETGPGGWAHTGANLALLVAIGGSLFAAGRLARHHTRRR